MKPLLAATLLFLCSGCGYRIWFTSGPPESGKYANADKNMCTTCFGKKKTTCHACSQGYVTLSNGESEKCNQCFGTGWESCTTCGGTGKR